MPKNSFTESRKAKLPLGEAEAVITAVRPIKRDTIKTRVTENRGLHSFWT